MTSVDNKEDGDSLIFIMIHLFSSFLLKKTSVWFDTDGCKVQFKCGRVFGCIRSLATTSLGVPVMVFQNVAAHGKSWSDGLGGAFKTCFRREEIKDENVKFEDLRSVDQAAYAPAMVKFYNLFHAVTRRPKGWLSKTPLISPKRAIDMAAKVEHHEGQGALPRATHVPATRPAVSGAIRLLAPFRVCWMITVAKEED